MVASCEPFARGAMALWWVLLAMGALAQWGCVERHPQGAQSRAGSLGAAQSASDPTVFRPAVQSTPIVIDPTRIPGTYGVLVPSLGALVDAGGAE
jgi:hypothetical protein